MANVKVTGKYPDKRKDGTALDPAKIAGVELFIGAGANPDTLATEIAAPDPIEHLFTDLEPGDWSFGAVVIDSDGRRGDKAIILLKIESSSPPGLVVDFSAEIVA